MPPRLKPQITQFFLLLLHGDLQKKQDLLVLVRPYLLQDQEYIEGIPLPLSAVNRSITSVDDNIV